MSRGRRRASRCLVCNPITRPRSLWLRTWSISALRRRKRCARDHRDEVQVAGVQSSLRTRKVQVAQRHIGDPLARRDRAGTRQERGGWTGSAMTPESVSRWRPGCTRGRSCSTVASHAGVVTKASTRTRPRSGRCSMRRAAHGVARQRCHAAPGPGRRRDRGRAPPAGDDHGIAASNDVSNSRRSRADTGRRRAGPRFGDVPSRFDADSVWPDDSRGHGTVVRRRVTEYRGPSRSGVTLVGRGAACDCRGAGCAGQSGHGGDRWCQINMMKNTGN